MLAATQSSWALEPVLELWVDDRPPVTEVTLDGQFDVSTAPQVRSVLNEMIERGCSRVVVDLSRVRFIDRAALGVLTGALRQVDDAGGSVVVTGSSSPVRRALELVGVAVSDGSG